MKRGKASMSYDFTADDAFELAEQLERNGARFYRMAAESVSDLNLEQMLMDLAVIEDDHEKIFAAIRTEFNALGNVQTDFDPQGESILYLHALADTRFFYEKEINIESVPAILKDAIAAEKDSIVFYLGLKDMVPEKMGGIQIDAIIKEEMGHIYLLSQKLKEVLSK
jgi:rubrerythrin